SAQIREILISESAWEEMTCLFAPSLRKNSKQKRLQKHSQRKQQRHPPLLKKNVRMRFLLRLLQVNIKLFLMRVII
ncbi:hypothetical protein C4Z09_014445, partial [Klebsiella pneumoniae subsp. pneumoniae]